MRFVYYTPAQSIVCEDQQYKDDILGIDLEDIKDRLDHLLGDSEYFELEDNVLMIKNSSGKGRVIGFIKPINIDFNKNMRKKRFK